MSDLRELYQEMILDHNRSPHHFHELADANRTARGNNPLCGDQLTVYLKLNQDKINAISFVGSGCAISKASASMMTDALQGKTKHEALQLFEMFHEMVTGHTELAGPSKMGKLAVFSGVAEYPARVKCASLAWHTMKSALEGSDAIVSTETGE